VSYFVERGARRAFVNNELVEAFDRRRERENELKKKVQEVGSAIQPLKNLKTFPPRRLTRHLLPPSRI